MVIIMALPVVAIIVNTWIQQRKDAINISSKDTQILADKIAREQLSVTESARQLLASLSQLPEIQHKDATKVTYILTKIHKVNPDLTNIFVADRSGLAWATAVPVTPPFIISDRRYFKNAISSGQFSSGEYVVSRAVKKPTFNFSYPIKDSHGVVTGVITLGYSLEKYSHILDRKKFPSNTSFVLLDYKGVFLYRAIEPDKFLGKQSDPSLFKRLQEAPDESTSVGTAMSTGDKRIISTHKMHLEGEKSPYMYIRVGIPVESAYEKANTQLLGNLVFFSFVVALALLFSGFIGERCIVSRIKRLDEASQDLAKGDYTHKIIGLETGGELGRLAESFNLMVTRLKEREESLESSERFLKTIIDSEPECIKLLDSDNNVQMMNFAGLELFEADSFEQIKEQSLCSLISEAHKDDYVALTKQVFQGVPGILEFEAIGIKGRRIWLETHAVPFRSESGEIVALLGIARNITERKQAEFALLESEKKHRFIIQTSSDGFWLVNTDGYLVEVNDTYCQMSGYSAQELLTMCIADLEAAEGSEATRAHMQKIKSLGEDRFESRHRRKDGSVFDVEVVVQYRPAEGGHFVVFLRDITQRKIAERTTALMNFALDSIHDAAYLTDENGFFKYVNAEACRVLGYSEDELLLMGVLDIEPSFPAGQWDAHWQELKTQRGLHFEVIHCKKDGQSFPAEITANYFEYGGIGYNLALVRDITERKNAEDALRDSDFVFKESQRSASIGSYKADFQKDQWGSSEVLDNIFGITGDYDRSIQGWLEIVHPDDRDMLSKHLSNDVILNGQPFSKQYRIIRRNDNKMRWVNGLGEVRFDSNGDVLSLIGTIQDITEMKNAEEDKIKLETQLQHAQKMESVGRLAGGVAHDFNNLLTVILGHANLALMKIDPSEAFHSDLEQIIKAGERSADLTRQLLAFARKQAVAPKILDLNEIVTGMLKMLYRLIGEDINLTWKPGVDLFPIKVDPSQVDQILANLCVNARDAISDVGMITIETENCICDKDFSATHLDVVPGEYVILVVSDNGCGMDKERLALIFDPFFTTKSLGKGTGLGLSTVYGVVKQNNGFIDVYSEPGLGTTFKIYLPRYVGEAKQAPTEAPLVTNLRGQETFLLVEDELAILNVVTQMLSNLGYTVLAANTPAEAIRLANEHTRDIHLLITDVIMPTMNGRDLAEKLLLLHPHFKHLFMSGYTADVIAHHGVLEEGAYFIQKPFSAHNLAVRVREVLDSK